MFATTVAYKPFHNQLAKRTFPDFMREVLSRILQQWVVEVLQPKAHAPLGEFGRILIQDGCSFVVKETLREQYPGRFNKQNPAAVELHVTMSLLDESVEAVTLTEDTASERAHLPSPEEYCVVWRSRRARRRCALVTGWVGYSVFLRRRRVEVFFLC